MEKKIADLITYLKEQGADNCAHLFTEKIPFNEEFRKPCEQNYCGHYNKNWMCPPNVGPFQELKEKALKYKEGILFQTICQLEDSYDFEGMEEGTQNHTKLLRKIIKKIEEESLFEDFLPLNVGPCSVCARCAIQKGEPCPFPTKAIASVEAYGIDVNAMVTSCGIPYNNGPNTVSYVSLILF